ncbi:MAG: hypothetical protein WBD50_05480 [Candidatus Rhabdochlamydia sp.]
MRWQTFVCSCLVFSSSLWGASFTVNTNADGGAGSLRKAITDLNASSDAENTITFNNRLATITLASDLPVILNPVTINGSITPQVIDGNGQYRLIASTNTLSINRCTLQNGAAIGQNGIDGLQASGGGGGGLGAGGAIYIAAGQAATLSNIILTPV